MNVKNVKRHRLNSMKGSVPQDVKTVETETDASQPVDVLLEKSEEYNMEELTVPFNERGLRAIEVQLIDYEGYVDRWASIKPQEDGFLVNDWGFSGPILF
jgi:hypothetical protein